MQKVEVVIENGKDKFTWVDGKYKFEGYQKGDLICFCNPFFGVPLELEIAIRTDGTIACRKFDWCNCCDYTGRPKTNTYLHTHETPDKFTATQEQIDTVSGLLSGRITYEGIKLAVGGTIQAICPIDVEREEKLIGKKIFLANKF